MGNSKREKKSMQLKPPLKWAGGKRWLIKYLEPIWEPHRARRLVEPFCGGLAVSLGLKPSRALLNDINMHVINFYKWLQRGFVIQIPMENNEDIYYSYRDKFNFLIKDNWDSKEAAQLFYYLNRTCYNGLCRFNNKGEFNVPFGKYRKINYVTDFLNYKDTLKDWQFTNQDFQELKVEPDDFIYADPPYDVDFTKYSKEDFTWEDQKRLAEWLREHPGPIVLSNQATGRIIELYKKLGFNLQILQGPRRISCDGNRTPAKEVLATKNL